MQAGSYTLMDTDYAQAGVPFRQALHAVATVISVNRAGGYAVADAGLKALGMDHGLPTVDGYRDSGTAPTSTRRSAPARTGPAHVGDRVGWPRRTSTRPSPTTSCSTSSATVRSSTPGPSTSAAGESSTHPELCRSPPAGRG